jgi:hypothetical protein
MMDQHQGLAGVHPHMGFPVPFPAALVDEPAGGEFVVVVFGVGNQLRPGFSQVGNRLWGDYRVFEEAARVR